MERDSVTSLLLPLGTYCKNYRINAKYI